MAFLTVNELNTVMYQYQMAEITEADSDIAIKAIRTAVAEVKGYLRVKYDVDAIFSAEGDNRDDLVLAICKTVAVWYIAQLSSVDMVYQHAKERYDRAIDWLKSVANDDGKNAPDLPPARDDKGDVSTRIKFGSNRKFNSEYW